MSTNPVNTTEVHAFYDDQAGVWVAESEQVPGLATEAETLEQLATKLERLIPELLELNVPATRVVAAIHLRANRTLHLVEEAVEKQLFRRTLAENRAANRDLSENEATALADEALS